MSIEQQPDRFRGCDRGFLSLLVEQLRNCLRGDVFVSRKFVAPTNHTRVFDVDRFLRVDLGPIIVICEDPASIRKIAGHDGGAVNDRGAWIDRMMISKSHSILCQLPSVGVYCSLTKSGRIPSQTTTTTCLSVGAAAVAAPESAAKTIKRIGGRRFRIGRMLV